MQDISNIIMRPSLSSGSILPYLNTNLTSLSGNDTSSIPVVPFNTTSSENLAPAFLSVRLTVNLPMNQLIVLPEANLYKNFRQQLIIC